MENLEGLTRLFLFFLFYAFVGYVVEVVYCSLCERRLVNRGFLFGPILPVYGFAMTAMLVLTSGLKDKSIVVFFLASILICSGIEYFASWFLERLVGIRWWDYSETEKYQLNGRISLKNSIIFGLISTFTAYIVHPWVLQLLTFLGTYIDLNLLARVCAILLTLDVVASSYAVGVVKNDKALRKKTGDQTNEIKRLARGAIAQLITGKTRAEQKFAETKRSAKKRLTETKRSLKNRQKKLLKKAR